MSLLAESYKFTTDEFVRLAETGLLDSKDRLELVNGELIVMHAIGYRHAQAVTNLSAELGEQSRRRYKVSPQNPVVLGECSAPQPDLALVPWKRGSLKHPTVVEIFLVVEVADTSLAYDRTEKLQAYAAAGVSECWILNLEADLLEVYRGPAERLYSDVSVIRSDGAVSPLAFPDVTIQLSEIIPPRLSS